jgi:transcriptional regulator with XRE-family HTH domain
MWLDNIKDLKKKANMSSKQLSEKANLPEKTISRILSGETKNPYIETLDRIATALGSTLTDILVDTKVVIGNESMVELKETVETANAEKDILIAENDILKNKVDSLNKELDLIKTELMFTRKLLAVHEYYTKTRDE